MVLTCMRLPQHSTNARLAGSNHDEHVFRDESIGRKFIDEFNMCEALDIGANFVLALDNVHAPLPKYAPRLPGGREVEV